MNRPSTHRTLGLVLVASLATCLAMLIVASGPGVAATQSPLSASPRGRATLASVSGTKYEDLNANGARDVGELGLEGWTIESYEVVSATLVVSGTTDANGDYQLALDPGDYRICEVLEVGWTQSFPGDDGCHSITLGSGDDLNGLDFGNWTTAIITGTKYNDLNANGDQDEGEPGLKGWTIYVDYNDNDQWDSGEPWGETGKDGAYTIIGIEPATATVKVREVLQEDWRCTEPAPCYYEETFQSGEWLTGVSFGNSTRISVSGTKWEDKNADGDQSKGELGLPDWTVYVDYNDNDLRDAGEPWDETDHDGAYTIEDVEPGEWMVREELLPGWFCSSPNGQPDPVTGALKSTNCTYTETFESGDDLKDKNFGNWTTAIITGTKWEDKDADSNWDAWEPGLAGWTIYVDYNDNELWDAGEPWGETGKDGAYTIFGVEPSTATVKVREVLLPGWTCWETGTNPCYYEETLESSAEITGKNFGNYRIRQVTLTSDVINAQPSISGSGQYVAFVSDRRLDPVGINTDGNPEIYRIPVPSGEAQLVTNSVAPAINEFPSINGDGAIIAFVSDADLVGDGSNADGNSEVFVAEQDTGWRITAITSTPGSIFPGFNLTPSIDDDGLHIAFASDYDLQPGTNTDGNLEIFIGTRGDSLPSNIQVTDSALCTNAQPSLSGNGQFVAFVSTCDLLLDGSNDDGSPEIFVAELDLESPEEISIIQVTTSEEGVTNAHPSISALGGRIAFISDGNLDPETDNKDGIPEVFVAELDPGSMQVIEVKQVTSSEADATNAQPSISGSGQYVAFVSDGNLDAAQMNTDGNPEIFVAELDLESLGVLSIFQVSYSESKMTGSVESKVINAYPSISTLGGRIAFISDGNLDPNIGNGDYNPEVFVATFATGSDIMVQKTASADLVRASEPLSYTITVQNNLGPPIPTVVLTDTLTSSVAVEKGALVPSQGSCGEWSDGTATCVLGVMEPAEVVTLTLVITPSQAGVIANTVLVSKWDDPFPDNNEDTVVLWPFRLHLPLILKMR